MKMFFRFCSAMIVTMLCGFNAMAADSYDVADGDLDDWNAVIEIPESVFTNAAIGTKVTISGNESASASADAPAQVQLAYKTPAEWTWTQFVDYADVVGGKYTFTVSDADVLAGLKAHGLYIKGQKFTVTKVTVFGATAVDEIRSEAIDFNAPVEIYNLQGTRVRDMEARGLYIVRQGKKVMKIAK